LSAADRLWNTLEAVAFLVRSEETRMAKIYEARIDHDAVEVIEVAPPRREGGWIWAIVFAVFLIGGATLGLTLATGSFSNAVEVAQNFANDGTSETATN
jgi:hypothetical protein